jgi:hypothetical protein
VKCRYVCGVPCHPKGHVRVWYGLDPVMFLPRRCFESRVNGKSNRDYEIGTKGPLLIFLSQCPSLAPNQECVLTLNMGLFNFSLFLVFLFEILDFLFSLYIFEIFDSFWFFLFILIFFEFFIFYFLWFFSFFKKILKFLFFSKF